MDYTAIKTDIGRYDTILATASSGATCFGAQALSRELAKMIAGHLNRHEDDFIAAHREDLTFFCKKMVEFSPYYSSRRVLQGQFLVKLGKFAEAAVSFREAYEIEKDIHYAWPHLQKTEQNMRILLWYGYALYHAAQEDDGYRFFDAGKKMEQDLEINKKMKSTLESPKPR